VAHQAVIRNGAGTPKLAAWLDAAGDALLTEVCPS
jgi:hypothetical protein